ncbi:MAG: PilZ domain-containing protein [Candidatus Acidiferrales bacterium]
MNGVKTETRRKTPRAKIASNEIVYLNFQSGNGAIVLDVSAEGLGFQAADPLEPDESLSFRISVPASPDIDLSGKIVWLDATRRRGGLRLIVPASVLPMLREWQRKYSESLSEVDVLPSSTPAPAAAPVPIPQPTVSAAPPQSEPERPSAPPPAASNQQRGPILGGRGPIFVSEWEAPPERSHTGRNVLVVCVIIALALVFAGSYYLGGRRQIGELLVRLGQAISGENAQQPAPSQTTNAAAQNPAPPATTGTAPSAPLSSSSAVPSPAGNAAELAAPELSNGPGANSAMPSKQPSGATSPSSSAPPPAPNTVAAVPPANAPRSNASSTPSQSKGSRASPAGNSAPGASGAGASTDAAAVEVAQARKYLQDSNPADSAIATDLLWSAIQDGSTQAELILGDLYLRGQGGVAKNCAQAEALLNAAQAANVPGAAEKLQELATYGCR